MPPSRKIKFWKINCTSRGGPRLHPIIFAKTKSKLVGKIHGQIRIQIALVRGFGCSISQSRKGREGKGRTYLVGQRSARRRTGKGGATPLSSPLGKEKKEGGRARARERRKGRGSSVREREAYDLHIFDPATAQQIHMNGPKGPKTAHKTHSVCFMFGYLFTARVCLNKTELLAIL